MCYMALSCIRMKSGPTAPAKGLTIGWRTSSRYFTAVRAPVSMTCKFHIATQRRSAPSHYRSTTIWVVFHDVALGVTLSRPSPHPYTSVTRGYMKAGLVCEEFRTPVAQLPILVILGKFNGGAVRCCPV